MPVFQGFMLYGPVPEREAARAHYTSAYFDHPNVNSLHNKKIH